MKVNWIKSQHVRNSYKFKLKEKDVMVKVVVNLINQSNE